MTLSKLSLGSMNEQERYEQCYGRAVIVSPNEYKIFQDHGLDMSCVFIADRLPTSSK